MDIKHVPFDQQAANAYGAWLLPDGSYVPVDIEEHYHVARQVATEKKWPLHRPVKLPSGSIDQQELFPYDVMYDHGCLRVVFWTQEKSKRIAGFEHNEAVDPSRVVEAMSGLPNLGIVVEVRTENQEYQNLADFKAKNGLEAGQAADRDYLRSNMGFPESFSGKEEEEEEAFSAYSSIMGWIKKTCAFARKP